MSLLVDGVQLTVMVVFFAVVATFVGGFTTVVAAVVTAIRVLSDFSLVPPLVTLQ